MALAHTVSDSPATLSMSLPVPPPAPAPVAKAERIATLDVLRGVALLGILPVNIFASFALHSAAMFNPTIAGGFEGLNRLAWWIMHVGFEFKMMTIFSMLFGAGVVAMDARLNTRNQTQHGGVARASSTPWAGVYYRRLGWLALFGMLHGYGIWYGDILFSYAACGLLLYPARRLPVGVLMSVGVVIVFIGLAISVGLGAAMTWWQSQSPEAYHASMAGEFAPTAEMIEKEIAARTGSYSQLFLWNAPMTLMMQFIMLPIMAAWRVLGVMFIGMAMFKSGVLTGEKAVRTYVGLAVAGYALGIPITVWGAQDAIAHNFDAARVYLVWLTTSQVGSLFMALGHVSVMLLVCKLGLLSFLRSALASVGRMAFTNYLSQTLICMIIFSGLGFGLLNQLDRVQLWGVAIGIWIVQLIFSVLWLRVFNSGPLEWVWRSLTYWRVQPMFIRSVGGSPASSGTPD